MLCGSTGPRCAVRKFDIVGVGGFGLRALFSKPSGVEEAVMEVVPCGSDELRKEGRRGVFEGSGNGLDNGDSSSSVDSGDNRVSAKSIESSGALST